MTLLGPIHKDIFAHNKAIKRFDNFEPCFSITLLWLVFYDWHQYGRDGMSIHAALVICGLFICNFAYMWSRNGLFSGTYPLIYSHLWSFCMQIRYMRAYFLSPYLSHITRSTCTWKFPMKIFKTLILLLLGINLSN